MIKKIFLLFPLLLSIGCSAESRLSSISGTITLSPPLVSKLEPSDVLQILAISEESMNTFNEEETKGKAKKNRVPVAIQKIAPITFPLKYKITEEDVLFPENRFNGKLFILAKIEKKNPKNIDEKRSLEGSYLKNPVAVGSKNIDIVIDQEKP